MSFSIDGIPVIDHIFVGNEEGELIASQWKVLAATFSVTEITDGRKLANALRKLAVPDNPATVQQVIALEGELSALEIDIKAKEAAMNSFIDQLYGLSPAEAALVDKG